MIGRNSLEGKDMATKSKKNLWGFSPEPLLLSHLIAAPPKTGRGAEVFVHDRKKAFVPAAWRSSFNGEAAAQAVRSVHTENEARVVLGPLLGGEAENDPRLTASVETKFRDVVGHSLAAVEKWDVQWVQFDFDVKPELLIPSLLGLEIALYRFKRVLKGEEPKLKLILKHRGRAISKDTLEEATALGVSVNLARHLVNLPPNLLNPETYAGAAEGLFSGFKNVKVEVWEGARLEKERMGLLMAVGQGSETPPRLVHLKYRPPGAKGAPVALVGKGITFDTGGLDIKPSSGMRLMKKDMGGSAAVMGVLHWAAITGVKVNLDGYLALAENAVSDKSFRPSDVITARNGLSVEIHNTDAEGRLVLADAMDVAATAKEKPRAMIDVATLTGAIKVALGSGLAGLFSTDPKLARDISQAGQDSGDLSWIMPLFQKYRGQMNSHFADMVNATDGFGGAVTAALFLEKFTGGIPWAHLDIYAWKDSADGAWLEGGGSGQSVQCLARWLSKLK